MKKVVLFTFMTMISSCGYTPKCKVPREGEFAFPLKMIVRNQRLYVLNTDAGTRYCSGFVSVFALNGDARPSFVNHIYPLPPEGGFPSMLGGFDVEGEDMVVSDRRYSRVILTSLESYEAENCTPPDFTEGCSSSVIDTFRDPLDVEITPDGYLFVSSTPYGEVRMYTRTLTSYVSAATYSFVSNVTETTTAFLSPAENRIYVTIRERPDVYYFDNQNGEWSLTHGPSLEYGGVSFGGVRRIVPAGDTLLILATSPDSLIVADNETLTFEKVVYSGSHPIHLATDGRFIAVANFTEDTVSFYHSESLSPLGTFPVCHGPAFIVASSEAGVFWVSCFFEHRVVAINVEGEIQWKLP